MKPRHRPGLFHWENQMQPMQQFTGSAPRVEEVSIRNGSIQIFLHRFKRHVGPGGTVDRVLYSPSNGDADMHAQFRADRPVIEVLDVLPPDDPQNLIQVARSDVAEALRPYYQNWLAQNGYAEAKQTRMLREIKSSGIVSDQVAAVFGNMLNVHHVEELAELSDANCDRVPVINARDIRSDEMAEMRETNAKLQAQVAELMAMMAKPKPMTLPEGKKAA
jgi:hypothetical protein